MKEYSILIFTCIFNYVALYLMCRVAADNTYINVLLLQNYFIIIKLNNGKYQLI